jgi:hypothetical protein
MKLSGHLRLRSLSVFPLILLALFSLISVGVNAQAPAADQAAVLQKLVDLPSLQPYFLKKADGSYDRVNIMQNPAVSIAEGVTVEKFGKPVSLLQRGDITQSTRSYFLFQQLNIGASDATVEADFFFFSGQTLHKLKAVVKMTKNNNEWQVMSSKLDQE